MAKKKTSGKDAKVEAKKTKNKKVVKEKPVVDVRKEAEEWFNRHGSVLLAHGHAARTIAFRAAYAGFGDKIPADHAAVAEHAIANAMNRLGLDAFPNARDGKTIRDLVIEAFVEARGLTNK